MGGGGGGVKSMPIFFNFLNYDIKQIFMYYIIICIPSFIKQLVEVI